MNKEFKEYYEKAFAKLMEFENEIPDLSKGDAVINSKILKGSEHITLLKKWLGRENMGLKLLYRASRDGFTGSAFHSKCDNKGETFSFVKNESNGNIFGGYLDKPWESKDAYINSSKSFLFSFAAKEKYPVKSGHETYGAYCNTSYGPTYGGGHDFYISGKSCNLNSYSYSTPDSSKLAGSSSCQCAEIEVFQITRDAGGISTIASDVSKDKAGMKIGGYISNESKKKLADYIGVSEQKFSLLYKGTEHGMEADKFHSRCDNKAPTVTFIRPKNSEDVIGGYTTQVWSTVNKFVSDDEAFVFSLQRDLFLNVAIPECAIFQGQGLGPCFGDDDTIAVFKKKNSQGKQLVVSNANDCYQDGETFSGGSMEFEPDEIEVYEILK
jgi:hypothetical protein